MGTGKPGAGSTQPATVEQESDEVSFERFYRECRPRVCAVLTSMSSDTRYIEDVAQEALVKTRSVWSRIRWYENPEAWTLKVAVRMLRRWQSRDSRQVELTDGAVVPKSAPTAIEGYLDLYEGISRLPAGNAAAVVLQLLGYSTIEIAGILCIEVAAAKARLSRGRRHLKRLLSDSDEEDR